MRKLLLVAVLTLSFNVFANSNYDFFQTAGWNAISNLNEIDTLTMDRNGLYNSRNLCTYIGSAQANIKLSMQAGMKYFLKEGREDNYHLAVGYFNKSNDLLPLCHKNLNESSRTEIRNFVNTFITELKSLL